jgi:hypothetical protein
MMRGADLTVEHQIPERVLWRILEANGAFLRAFGKQEA